MNQKLKLLCKKKSGRGIGPVGGGGGGGGGGWGGGREGGGPRDRSSRGGGGGRWVNVNQELK